MPQLLVFAPCEKVIISQDENNPTLVAVLTELGGEYQTTGQPLPPNFILPLRWSIFCLWKQEPGDEGKTFEQRIRLRSPSGPEPMRLPPLKFRMEKTFRRVYIRAAGIPVSENGTWLLELYLTEVGAPVPQKPLTTFPLSINLIRKAAQIGVPSGP
jgi:hypothetical protein